MPKDEAKAIYSGIALLGLLMNANINPSHMTKDQLNKLGDTALGIGDHMAEKLGQ